MSLRNVSGRWGKQFPRDWRFSPPLTISPVCRAPASHPSDSSLRLASSLSGVSTFWWHIPQVQSPSQSPEMTFCHQPLLYYLMAVGHWVLCQPLHRASKYSLGGWVPIPMRPCRCSLENRNELTLCPSTLQSLNIQDPHWGLAVQFTSGQIDSMKPEANGANSWSQDRRNSRLAWVATNPHKALSLVYICLLWCDYPFSTIQGSVVYQDGHKGGGGEKGTGGREWICTVYAENRRTQWCQDPQWVWGESQFSVDNCKGQKRLMIKSSWPHRHENKDNISIINS